MSNELIKAAKEYIKLIETHMYINTSCDLHELKTAEVVLVSEIKKAEEENMVDNSTGAICTDCDQNMLESDGCIYSFMLINNNYYKRILVIKKGLTGEGRCHDCGAFPDNIHHMGCDMETCPVCKKGQLITCDCVSGEYKTTNVEEVI